MEADSGIICFENGGRDCKTRNIEGAHQKPEKARKWIQP